MFQGKGRCACAGVTYGKILQVPSPTQSLTKVEDSYLSVEEELALFHSGIEKSKEDLAQLAEKARNEIGDEQAEIFEIHLMMLDDPDICENIENRIKGGAISAAAASIEVGVEQAREFEALDDDYMRERAADIKDITERIARNIQGTSNITLVEPSIIVADDLQPSQTVALDRSLILGFVLRQGTQNSHASILARTMNIPLIINANLNDCELCQDEQGNYVDNALNGHIMGLDAETGIYYIDPDQDTIKELQQKKDAFDAKRIRHLALRGQASITKNGQTVYTFANIGQPDDVEQVLENDAEGIGLFRSEFLFLGREEAPSEDEQFKAYAKVASTMDGRLVIIRTLDIGADKQASYIKLPHEENPALGVRALRLCLQRKDLFKTQLRAIYKAAARGNIAMMFPMVTRVKEIEQAKEICHEVEQELRKEGCAYKVPKIGIMIETPAAVLLSHELAKHVDFFSVGTNDLNQYITACDRQNQNLGEFYDPHHEAVLEALRIIAKNAHAAGIPVGICGELAADLELTDLFIEMGYDELSVSPGAILSLREKIRLSNQTSDNVLTNPKTVLGNHK